MRPLFAGSFKVFLTAFSYFCLLALPGCPRPIPDPAPLPVPVLVSDAGGEMTCADACERAMKLGCKAADPSPKGVSCLEVCINVMASGVVSFNLKCKARAASCAQFDACN